MATTLPKPPEAAPAKKAPETRQPGFLAAVPAGRAPELARFGQKDRGSDERLRGVVDLPEKRAQTAALHALHSAPAGHPGPQPEPRPPPPPPALDPAVARERDNLAHAVRELELQAARLAEQARSDALEIAFQIAQKIIESELRSSPEPLFALVRSALRQAGEARKVKLRLSPPDADLLRAARGEEAITGLTVAKIEIASDASLGRGDVVVDTDFGHVDGRLATRFSELRRALATDAA